MKEEAIFHEVLKRPEDDREAFLEAACGGDADLRERVEGLLRAEANPGSFLQQPAVAVAATLDRPVAQPLGSLIGPYKLLEQIGEGGMGVVYVAEQTEPVRRRVALKIIKPGMDTKQVIARFEAERQALAMMDHPHIAKVLDASTTDAGRPYFVMELVRGLPVTEYCDKARLSPRQRLELFIDVCHAVQHAHQKGVIHRDLKPSNVMITVHDGRPVAKVIDFGVAKAVGQQLTERTVYTAHTQLVGTPLYMSPEQADFSSQDVDTRSDVYSLGVLLYELLTGQTPFDKETLTKVGFDEMRRIIREDEPPCPSRRFSTLSAQTISTVSQHRSVDERHLGRVLRGELDWIVMKALEKDRSRRYESASALAADIQRYLSDEPVLACPPTTMYRCQKFARKHKPALATAAAIAACLILGTTVSAWQAVRATTAEEQATANEQKAVASEQKAVANAAAAEQKEQEAIKQRDEVKALNEKLAAKEQQLTRTLYAANMKLAKVAWEDAAVHQAQELLEEHRPRPGETDLRGFEWYYLNRLCHSEIRTFKLTTGQVHDVAFSPDGKRLASAAGQEVKVWDVQTGRELLTFKGHTRQVNSVAFSPDSKRLASAGLGALVKIWDAESGHELLSLTAAGAQSVTFNPDGKQLATGSGNNTVRVWNSDTGQELLTLTDAGGNVSYSPDGKRLASANNNLVKLWDSQTGEQLLTIGSGNLHNFAVFSPDGQRLATSAVGPTIKIWDAQTGQELLTLNTTRNDGTRSVAFSPDGKRLASVGGDRTVKMWNAATGQELFAYQGHSNTVTSVAFSPDGTTLASGSLDGKVKMWDATKSPVARTLSMATGRANGIVFTPDGKRIASSDDGSWNAATRTRGPGEVNVRDVQTGRKLLSIKGQAGQTFACVALSSDGKHLAAGTGTQDSTRQADFQGEVKIWDAVTGQELLTIKAHSDGVNNLAFSPDGKRLASSAAGLWDVTIPGYPPGEVKLWDVETGRETLSLKGNISRILALAFSPDGQRLATYARDATARDSTVKVWDAQTGQEILSIKAAGSGMRSVVFSPDGARLAGSTLASNSGVGAGAIGEVNVWDAQTGKELLTLKGHTAEVSSVVYSPDGKRLFSASGNATGGESGEVKVWDAQTGRDLLTLKGARWGHRVAISPDCHRLASTYEDKIKVYDATPLPEKP